MIFTQQGLFIKNHFNSPKISIKVLCLYLMSFYLSSAYFYIFKISYKLDEWAHYNLQSFASLSLIKMIFKNILQLFNYLLRITRHLYCIEFISFVKTIILKVKLNDTNSKYESYF